MECFIEFERNMEQIFIDWMINENVKNVYKI